MNPIETVKLSGAVGAIILIIFSGSVWLLRMSIIAWLEKELEKKKGDLAKELATHKRELDLKFEHAASLQERKRKLFEEFSISIEEIFAGTGDDEDVSRRLNRMFGLLALYAPDEVYRNLRQVLEGRVAARDVKPILYNALRKDLFGNDTKMTPSDFVKHFGATRESP